MFNHPVSDLVAIIRNGYMAKRDSVKTTVSKIRENILKILKEEGYILGYSKIVSEDKKEYFNIHLKYSSNQPVINEIKVISKPGKRVYCSFNDIPLVKNGLGMVVISTSKGIIADHQARVQKLGGEVLLTIF
jgi:small subunit ribosomal protein S8